MKADSFSEDDLYPDEIKHCASAKAKWLICDKNNHVSLRLLHMLTNHGQWEMGFYITAQAGSEGTDPVLSLKPPSHQDPVR